MTALKAYQREQQQTQNITATMNDLTARMAYLRLQQEETKKQQEEGWLVDVFAEFDRELLDTSTKLDHLRQERGNMQIMFNKDKQNIESYGQRTIINLKEGIIMINDTLQFPYKLTLDQNSKTKTFIDNPQNRERLKKIYGLANILNRAQYLSTKILDKAADHYQPFHIDKGGMNIISPIIQVENGTDDLNLIKIKSLESYAKSFDEDLDIFTTSLVNFLNKVHKSQYETKPTSTARIERKGRTY